MITEELMNDWGGETLMVNRHESSGAFIIVAIHSTKSGPAAGGVRMKKYDGLDQAVEDVLKLSSAMTYKFATANMNWGGGKSVISIPHNLGPYQRTELLHDFGEILKTFDGSYYVGPDVGTSSEDMDVIFQTGAPYVFSRTKASGGAGSSANPTAYGVFCAIQTTCKRLFGTKNLNDRTVLVQGAGNVGGLLMNSLRDAGAHVLFSETSPKLVEKHIDIGYRYIPDEAVFSTKCDVFSPCAMGGVLNKHSIPLLSCKGVVGAANNQLAHRSDAELLEENNILYAPDYIVSLGGAIGITAIEGEGMTFEQSRDLIKSSIQETLELIYEMSDKDSLPVLDAADKIVEQRVKRRPLMIDTHD